MLPTEAARAQLRHVYRQPTAVWLDALASLPFARRALADAATQTPPPLVTLVVYNLPNRDCAARSSGGELCCARMPPNHPTCEMTWGGDCAYGLGRYEAEFLTPLADMLREFSRVPTALVIEPDSLPNLITAHSGACRGRATTDGYKRGVSLAVKTLAPLASATYLDAGHGGYVACSLSRDLVGGGSGGLALVAFRMRSGSASMPHIHI